MLVQKYKDMLSGKSVIRQLSEFATARGQGSDTRMYLITAWGILPFRFPENLLTA